MLRTVNVLISRGRGRVINELPGELGPGNVRPPEPTIQHYFWTLTLCKHFSDSNSTAQFPDSGSNTGTYIFGLWSHSATINFRTLALIQLPVHTMYKLRSIRTYSE